MAIQSGPTSDLHECAVPAYPPEPHHMWNCPQCGTWWRSYDVHAEALRLPLIAKAAIRRNVKPGTIGWTTNPGNYGPHHPNYDYLHPPKKSVTFTRYPTTQRSTATIKTGVHPPRKLHITPGSPTIPPTPSRLFTQPLPGGAVKNVLRKLIRKNGTTP